jgi:hypothetical protein
LLTKTIDTDKQQKIQATGRNKENFGGQSGKHGAPRVQQYGYTSIAPANTSHGVTLTPDGNPDKAMVFGLEDGHKRPKNLQEKELKEYDFWSHYRFKQEDKWTDKVGTAMVLYQESGGIVHLNPPSSVLFEEGFILEDGVLAKKCRPELSDPEVYGHRHHLTAEEVRFIRQSEADAEAKRRLITHQQTEDRLVENHYAERLLELEQKVAALQARLDAINSEA